MSVLVMAILLSAARELRVVGAHDSRGFAPGSPRSHDRVSLGGA
jgi:hypothetical protein